MTNKEKYKDKIADIAIDRRSLAVNKDTLEPTYCHNIQCENCIAYNHNCGLRIKEWAEQEYKPYFDWTKVKKDTPILVSQDDVFWHKRHFCKYEGGMVYAYINGKTSFSARHFEISTWKYAKLAD